MIIERTVRGFTVTVDQISTIPSIIDEHVKQPLVDLFEYAVWIPSVVEFISHLLKNVIAFCSMFV